VLDNSPEISHPTDWALEVIGDRWSLRIVEALLAGPARYGELTTAIGAIAPNVLAARLRHLEQRGIVHVRPYQERPRRLQYELSADGSALAPVIGAMREWSAHRHGIGTAATHARCGCAITHHAWCPTCATPATTSLPSDTTWL
jgi:DNA-binding HxlR family transcriptional regulator